jgi:hypothetical protein
MFKWFIYFPGILISSPYRRVSWFAGGISHDDDDDDGVRLSLNYVHQQAYCSSPRWYMSVECYGGMITGYCYGVLSYKVSQALRSFHDLLCIPILFIVIPDLFTRALWQIPADTPSSKVGRKVVRNVC